MANKKIAVLGSGVVGQTLADGFLKHGYDVIRGSREPSKLASWKSGAGAKASVGTFGEAAKQGDIVVLAVKGGAAEEGPRTRRPRVARGQNRHRHDQPDRRRAADQRGAVVLHDVRRVTDGASEEAGALRAFRQGLLVRGQRLHGEPRLRRHQADDVHLRRSRWFQRRGPQHPRPIRMGDRGHGQRRRSTGHRAALHLVVHPGLTKNQWGHAFKLLKK